MMGAKERDGFKKDVVRRTNAIETMRMRRTRQGSPNMALKALQELPWWSSG